MSNNQPWRTPSLSGLVRHAVEEFKLVEPGDRILLGASGGKDSTALAKALSDLRHAYNKNFEIVAVHVSTDLGVNAPVPQLRDILASWDIELVEIKVGVRERLKPGRTMNCYWCSTQRRTDLLAWAMEHGCNKMALGHHLDDILETMFMNMMQKGELSTMPVKLAYNKYPLTIIRPLALVEERQIIDWIQKAGLASATCTCPFGINSHRRDIRQRIATLTEGFPGAKLRLFRSLGNMKPTYLPGFACTENPAAQVHDNEGD